MTNPSIGTLCDDFSQGSVNSALWTTPFIGIDSSGPSLAGIEPVGVPITLTPAPSIGGVTLSATANVPSVVSGNGTGIGSVVPYDLTGSGLSVEITSYTDASGYIARFALCNNQTYPSAQWLSWYLNSTNSISADYGDPVHSWPSGSASTYTFGASFRFVRIRESGGSIYWDYSPDGINWTNATSMSNPFAVTGLYANIYSASGSGSTGWANVDYVL